MLSLFLLSVYPHYYGWWMAFNYINDDFYLQVKHQFLFTGVRLQPANPGHH